MTLCSDAYAQVCMVGSTIGRVLSLSTTSCQLFTEISLHYNDNKLTDKLSYRMVMITAKEVVSYLHPDRCCVNMGLGTKLLRKRACPKAMSLF